MNRANLFDFMAGCRLGVLGSIGASGAPQAALVGIAVTPQLEIVFDTVKGPRKYENLTQRPGCSFVIGWSGEQTVQYEGEAKELAGSELERFQAVYFRVWPESIAHMRWPDISYFVVRPTWIRYSDFSQTPNLIREFDKFAIAHELGEL